MAAVKRERFRKEVKSPFTGQDYLIRKIDVGEYLREAGVLPVSVASSVDEQLRKISDNLKSNAQGDPEIERRLNELTLKSGIIKDADHPGVWFGKYEDCPEDEIPVDDLGSDKRFLINQISEFSFDMSGLKEMEKFFRGTGARDSGPGSEEVRSEAVIPAPEEAV